MVGSTSGSCGGDISSLRTIRTAHKGVLSPNIGPSSNHTSQTHLPGNLLPRRLWRLLSSSLILSASRTLLGYIQRDLKRLDKEFLAHTTLMSFVLPWRKTTRQNKYRILEETNKERGHWKNVA
ncbi:hypothetical protein G4B88_017826 [Cannabis sativa]|uniref:Uncharacterized protein n=1 Tax=Cannabis sativa TaxID=3483 RepID=A0A7J6DRM7_CANSA|nr:hypothetical protein G4B88_017826 [Cannabis sativa]